MEVGVESHMNRGCGNDGESDPFISPIVATREMMLARGTPPSKQLTLRFDTEDTVVKALSMPRRLSHVEGISARQEPVTAYVYKSGSKAVPRIIMDSPRVDDDDDGHSDDEDSKLFAKYLSHATPRTIDRLASVNSPGRT